MSSPISVTTPEHNKIALTTYKILFIISICHLLNDTLQAVVPAMFPILEKEMGLTFTQLGVIAAVLNIVSSLFQPVIGWFSDKKPRPYALPLGLACSLLGMLMLALIPRYSWIIFSVALVGMGSAVFHPEGSRVAHLAAGSKKGLAQSIYQVGGNSGQALAPLITALILVPFGQFGAIWFTFAAALAVLLLTYIAKWYRNELHVRVMTKKKAAIGSANLSKTVWIALILTMFILLARSLYIVCMTNYYSFYIIKTYHFSITTSQAYLFAFLISGAVGTFFGGPLGDRFGKKNVILYSLLGSAPFTILLPYVGPISCFVLILLIGFIMMTSFSVSVVYAQDLVPSKIGTMSGLTVGFIFGLGAIGSVLFGNLADLIGITKTISIVGFLPILGVLGFFLPSEKKLAEIHK
ncbi:MFS transporter [Shimazuella sp. AN120528]|uniref:MFS transporter n=1 Tax=Shimazuella soli TaxID=1892854 RepID=UPI001F0F3076|nr:MFS transporter [Shimazuella soli]MCH5585434.1 MFS transporter [Shimazuella soli]